MTIMFNGTNISECLKVLDTDEIVIVLMAPNKPAMLTGLGNDSFIYVFSPIVRKTVEAAS